jgi:hypothetical protein
MPMTPPTAAPTRAMTAEARVVAVATIGVTVRLTTALALVDHPGVVP